MIRPILIVSQSDSLIQSVAINSHIESQAVQIQIRWLLKKPTDLYLHCLQRHGIFGFSSVQQLILQSSHGILKIGLNLLCFFICVPQYIDAFQVLWYIATFEVKKRSVNGNGDLAPIAASNRDLVATIFLFNNFN